MLVLLLVSLWLEWREAVGHLVAGYLVAVGHRLPLVGVVVDKMWYGLVHVRHVGLVLALAKHLVEQRYDVARKRDRMSLQNKIVHKHKKT